MKITRQPHVKEEERKEVIVCNNDDNEEVSVLQWSEEAREELML
jgi:hypothetical protein